MIRALRNSAIVALCVAPFASAGQTWNFDITTTGNNVNWTSPTNVDPNAAVYAAKYAITKVEVDVTWVGIPFNDIDVTNQVPPELQASAFEVPGPAPVAALDVPVVVPPPPTAPAFSANLSFGLNAGGFGYAGATNVVLGSMLVTLPIFGQQTVVLKSVRLVGSLTMHGAWFNLGNGKAGSTGVPVLTGSGALSANAPLAITLSGAAPSSSSLLIIGLNQLNAPFYGGVMVPTVDLIINMPTDGLGGFTLPAIWPAGIPANFSIYMQTWVINATSTGVNGASNALRAVAQ